MKHGSYIWLLSKISSSVSENVKRDSNNNLGSTLLQTHLPDLTASASSASFLETFYLSCLLHDIGTTPTNLKATLMSFETYGGFLALTLLQSWGASKEQAESVCEAIVRHQDLGDSGEITGVGGLIQVVTLLGKCHVIVCRSTKCY